MSARDRLSGFLYGAAIVGLLLLAVASALE
jgi:hypothetical protein